MATQPNASGLRLLKILKLLKGRSLTGLSHAEIAAALATPKPTISRDLATLVQERFVVKLESYRYALSVEMLSISEAHRMEMQRARDRIQELEHRVSAAAR